MTARRECLIRASGTRRCTPAEFLPSLPLFSLSSLSFYCEGARRRPARKESQADADRGKTMHNGRSSGRLKCNGGIVELCVGQRLALKLKSRAKRYGESKVREWWMGGLTTAREVRGVGL